MISIIDEVIEPLTQAAIWGAGGYLASKAGSQKAKSAIKQKEQNKQHAKQAVIGATAGGAGAFGASGISKLVRKTKEAITDD